MQKGSVFLDVARFADLVISLAMPPPLSDDHEQRIGQHLYDGLDPSTTAQLKVPGKTPSVQSATALLHTTLRGLLDGPRSQLSQTTRRRMT